jgi:thymidylate kinase
LCKFPVKMCLDMWQKGKLVALECADETVLERQVQRLYRWLDRRGIAVEHTAEPTGGPVGAQLALVQRGRLSLDPLSHALYDLADRMDHLGRPDGMLAWLSEGRTVLCAHYVAFSYACHLDHVDLDWLVQINARCQVADLTLFLDVEPQEDAIGLHTRYQTALRALQRDGQTVLTVDGRDGEDQLYERCCQHIAALHGREA